MGYLSLPINFDAYKKRTYGHLVSKEILDGYNREDDFVLFHESDRDLAPIKIFLPTAPDWDKIDGFGLTARKQKFKVPQIPKRLIDLPKEVGYYKIASGDRDAVTIDDVFDHMQFHQREYRKEIEFIKLMWYYRLYGYWCFINGKPTYIEGHHFFYLCFNHIDIGLPHYRDRDRRIFMAIRYFEETKEALYNYKLTYLWEDEAKEMYFSNIDDAHRFKVTKETEAEDLGIYIGSYDLKPGLYVRDMKHRTTMGVIYPKHRREGATYKADSIGIEIITRSINKKAGILSMTGEHASKAFQFHVMQPFRELIWFFKPNYEGSDAAKSSLSLKPAAKRIGSKGTHVLSQEGLNSVFNFATTASGSWYDSQKLIYLHEDECGKTELEDVYERNDVTKHCMLLGAGAEMIGFTFKTSTVGEMTKKGGEKFHKLCQASLNNERNELGNTQSESVVVFISAVDGLDGYIGEYGESIIDTPTDYQAEYIGRDIGARRHLEIKEQQLRARKDKDALKDLNEFFRLTPTQYRDCFRRNSSNMGFNIAILADRTNELRFDRDACETGKFIYDRQANRVEWKRDREGKFELSLNLDHSQANNFFKDENGLWTPGNSRKFVASSDAFKFIRTEGDKMSMGAGTVFMNRDYNIDPHEKPSSEWQTHRWVCDYLGRPDTKNEYCEDMLYMCLYFGCKMSPEINVDDVWRYFEENGFINFLHFFPDPSTGLPRKTPGYNANTGSKNDIFNAIRDHVELHGMRERHLRILEQIQSIDGIEEMTKYDAFASAGGSLISSESVNNQSSSALGGKDNMKDPDIDLDDFFDL